MDESVQTALRAPKARRGHYIEVYEGVIKGQWYWRMKSQNHKTVADSSEWYTRKGGAVGAVRKLIRVGALGPDIPTFYRSHDGKWLKIV